MTDKPLIKDPFEQRFIKMRGSVNFRDFGGYLNRHGRQVRRGKLFRCGSLANIPAEAHGRFEALDIGVICDLRRHAEVEEAPTPDAPPFGSRIHIPIDPGSTIGIQDAVGKSRSEDFLAGFMTGVTRELVREHTGAWRTLFEALLGTERSFLLHCSAGKDRTGFGAAIILAALGVDEETIMQDYLLSNRMLEVYRARRPRVTDRLGNTMNDATLRVVAGVQRAYLEAAFEEVHQHFGSVDVYLEAVGVDAAARKTLHDRLLEPELEETPH